MPGDMTQSARLLSVPLETRILVYKHIFDGQIVNACAGEQKDLIRIAAILRTCSQIHGEALPVFSASVPLSICTHDPFSVLHLSSLGIGKDRMISSLRKVNWVTTDQPAAKTTAAFAESFPNLESFVLDVQRCYVHGRARNPPGPRDKAIFDYPNVMDHLRFSKQYRSILRWLLSVFQSLRGRGVKQPEVLFKNRMSISWKTDGRSYKKFPVRASTMTFTPR